MAVAALDFDFVWGEGRRVPHDKRVSFDQMFLPVVVNTCLPVAHLVLEARAIVFDGQKRLQTAQAESFFFFCFLTVVANKQMCPRTPYLPADVHLVRKIALDLDVCWVSAWSFDNKKKGSIYHKLKEKLFEPFFYYAAKRKISRESALS